MVLLLLCIKLEEMENVESVSLPANVTYTMTIKNATSDDTREDVVIDPAEVHELDGSRGTANFRIKFDKSSKHQAYLNVEPVKGVTRAITGDDANEFVPVMGFECRGLDLVSYKPDVFIVKSKGGATFEADLSEGEWADFDEKLGESVSIMGISSEFRTHKRYEPADVQFGTQCEGTRGEEVCFGGVSRQVAAINSARAAAARRGVDTLVLHAGDQYTGTLYDAVFTKKGQQIAADFLRLMGVQAFTLGNHEFDNGPTGAAGLEGFIRSINGSFPVLSCNLDASSEPALAGLVQRFALLPLQHSNVTVGVVGLTSVETPETSNPGPTVKFLPYADTLPACVADARAAGADIIVGLTHIGFEDDQALAASPAAAGVDLIVGGHTHTFLYTGAPPPLLVSPPTNETTEVAGDFPTWVSNGSKRIPIAQALYGSRYLGLLNTTWAAEQGQSGGLRLEGATGAPLLLGGKNSTNYVPDDPVAAARLAELQGPLNDYAGTVVGEAATTLDGERVDIRNRETNLGDAMCDAILAYAARHTGLLGGENAGRPVVCLVNGGVFRASIQTGNVTQGDCLAVTPYGNWFVAKAINASTLTAALNNGFSGWTGNVSAQGRFPQIGGALRAAFDPVNRVNTSRLVGAELRLGNSSTNGSTVPLASYTGEILLLSTDYLLGGGDFYTMLKEQPILFDSSKPLNEILAEEFQLASPLAGTTDGRMVNCADDSSSPLCGSQPARRSRRLRSWA